MMAFAGMRARRASSVASDFHRRRQRHRAQPQPRTTARFASSWVLLAENRDVHDAGVVQVRCPVQVPRPSLAAL